LSEKNEPQPSVVPESQANEFELTEADIAQVAGGLSTLTTTVQVVSDSSTIAASDAQKQQMERWKIMQDTQTKA